ncbi:MAG: 23S rRNA (adenine(2030)-N(6))-methyltransferase RlmJ [Treponema sp.]|nr:23S rRNA (adenine(2030)-N(6))-methyltransferase RlmJ [Treponema sp.]
MLSYLHSFHAGNHADILKHVTLLYTLLYFNKKDKPYTVFDTHSGRGLYDLESESALKTGEAKNGICRLLQDFEQQGKCPEGLVPYIDFVKDSLKKGFYPGSPAIEKSFIKEAGTLFLTELHKTEYDILISSIKSLEGGRISVHVENKDGFAFLSGNTPPVVKRGFILCDPSYEEERDYFRAAEILSAVHKKWSGATILLWYPLLANRAEEIENMKQSVLATVKNRDSHTEILDASLLVDSPESHVETILSESIGNSRPRLYGSGMFVVNPCWGLDVHLKSVLPYLSELLGREGNGDFSVSML